MSLVKQTQIVGGYENFRHDYFKSYAELDSAMKALCGEDWRQQEWASFWLNDVHEVTDSRSVHYRPEEEPKSFFVKNKNNYDWFVISLIRKGIEDEVSLFDAVKQKSALYPEGEYFYIPSIGRIRFLLRRYGKKKRTLPKRVTKILIQHYYGKGMSSRMVENMLLTVHSVKISHRTVLRRLQEDATPIRVSVQGTEGYNT